MRINKIAVLVSGGGTNLQRIIDEVQNGNIPAEICAVISDKPDVFALERAKNAGIPAVTVNKKAYSSCDEFNAAMLNAIRASGAEGIILAGYLSIIDKAILAEYKDRIINIHPSLIPSFCGDGFYGKRVHRAVLEYGAKVSGATTHFVDEGTDTGAIIMQDTVPVLPGDTPETLAARVLTVEHRILPLTVKAFAEGRIVKNGRQTYITEV